MASIDEIRQARLGKLNLLISKGLNPFPTTTHQDFVNKEAIERFDKLSQSKESIYLAGRILSIRAQGKIIFFHFDDGTGKFQALFKSGEEISYENFKLFEDAFDIGDFVDERHSFLTKKEEKTILAEKVRMLSKSLRPLPENGTGLM